MTEPNIKPVLSDAEWSEGSFYVWVRSDGTPDTIGPFVRIDSGRLVVVDADYYVGYTETISRPAAMVALANAALPDSDPRKITREWIVYLRAMAQQSEAGDFGNLPHRIADALESYLPPRPAE